MHGMQVTFQIPPGAPPGTILAVPVKGGSEKIKIRVPDGLGAGSTLILTQPEGSEEWDMKVGTVVPLPPEESPPEAELSPLTNGRAPVFSEDGRGSDTGYADARYGEAQSTERSRDGQLEVMSPSSYQYQGVEGPEPSLDNAVAFTVRLDTTVGVIEVIVRPDWAPHGANRFLRLAASGDLADLSFYRSIKSCIAQFGLPIKRQWPPIPDDPPTGVPFLLGAVSFAAIGENSRKSTLFICTGDMSHCLGNSPWETPIGAVAESSLDVLDRIETVYGDIAEFGGAGPDTSRITTEGASYLQANFPRLTYINAATPLDWHEDMDLSQQGGVQHNDVPRAIPHSAQEAKTQAAPAAHFASNGGHPDHVAVAIEAARRARAAADAAEAAADAVLASHAAQSAQSSSSSALHGSSSASNAKYSTGLLGSVRSAGIERTDGSRTARDVNPATGKPWSQPGPVISTTYEGASADPKVEVPVEVAPPRTGRPGVSMMATAPLPRQAQTIASPSIHATQRQTLHLQQPQQQQHQQPVHHQVPQHPQHLQLQPMPAQSQPQMASWVQQAPQRPQFSTVSSVPSAPPMSGAPPPVPAPYFVQAPAPPSSQLVGPMAMPAMSGSCFPMARPVPTTWK
eukprot:TRINITY_DN2821_c0_g1_i1.p1 TRINITY_DN2821_c0_g1~~TRINITY_DN2821_c0_g1_i1.p1  ORF type:complete len:625 (-),score=83.73 TRINITY_DN2821_c0_g1_i1:127-2001(-)